jgi:1-acyl-sn-glycerol-3-phosphate acyltransferase
MRTLFIKIFIFFKRRKSLRWLLLTGIAALLTVSALRISFVEDISSFLPDSDDNKRVNEAYQHIGAANKIIVRIAPSPEGNENAVRSDVLEEAATRFAEILLTSDNAEHIRELICEIDDEKINATTGFITQNPPYFLDDDDYARIDSLIQPHNLANQLKASRELLMSPAGGFVRNVVVNDPLHFSQNALKNLEVFKQNDSYYTDNGFIFNSRGECIVTVASKYPVSETANNKLLANAIYTAANQTQAEFSDAVKIVPFGAALISITNAEQIKNDSVLAVSIALILILALLFYFFRNVKSLLLIALSVVFGALFALGAIVLFKSTVSIIAVGIASIIVGIAINYPLHFLAHQLHTADVKRTLKEVINPLLTGNITTIGAFLSLLFISSDAMRDLGLFASLLLVGTMLFVLVFLPHFIDGGKVRLAHEEIKFRRLAEFSPEKNRLTVVGVLIFTIVLFFFGFGTEFETNLHTINYMTAEQRAEMNRLMEENRNGKYKLYVVADGQNIDEALDKYHRQVLPKINFRLNEIDSVTGLKVAGTGNYFPSKEVQRQKIARWNEFWQDKKADFLKNFVEISAQQGYNPGAFDDFVKTLNHDFQVEEFDYFYEPMSHLAENYISRTDDRAYVYTVLTQPHDFSETKAGFNIDGDMAQSLTVFDDASIAQKMVDALSDDFNRALYICGFIVLTFLFFSFGRIELAVLTFIPLTVGWLWILGLMNVFDLKFNIVNIILATFIFGQGDDYTIFVTEGLISEYARGKKMLASFKNSIILSATILFIAIGMLIFAKHPAMRSLAQLTIVGMATVVACAYLFPPLIFRFLTAKKGKLREAPWTLRRFLIMTYAFAVFLAGSLLITVYGFILFGFRTKQSEKNKLRYHRLLRRIADFVIRRVPDVKFRYENLSGETFDRPAVIISNHQSHLDLMCLMMLTPKLIILTNDWVWRNPFYGRLIRYANFYPVSQGVENCIAQLSDAVRHGYSIVIFPEGTRSPDCSIGRFHRGAFYLAERLQLDVVPVFLHGVGHVLPKNDFLLRKGQITVQIHERITSDDSRFAADYVLRSKQIRQYYRATFAEMCKKIETEDYFKSFVMYNYMYKGVEVWQGAKKELSARSSPEKIDEDTVVFENNGYGVRSFMFALANRKMQVIAVEDDDEKTAIARNCAGLPQNLKIYCTEEWRKM